MKVPSKKQLLITVMCRSVIGFFALHRSAPIGLPLSDEISSQQEVGHDLPASKIWSVRVLSGLGILIFIILIALTIKLTHWRNAPKFLYTVHQQLIEKYRMTITGAKQFNILPSPDPQGDSLDRTKLPVIELTIPTVSQRTLTDCLPTVNPDDMKSFSIFAGVSASKWPYVPAVLTYAGRNYQVDIRYRGWNMDHYMLHKKSWRVKFKKDDLFYGLKQINIINQRDNYVFRTLLMLELLRESGMLVADQFLVHLRINGQFVGLQLYLEQPDRRFLIKHNRVEGVVFGEEIPLDSKEKFLNRENWQAYSGKREEEPFDRLHELYEAVYKKGASEYKTAIEDILDVDHYLTYCVHAAIFSMQNPSSHNNRWLYDPALGRFQIIPWYQSGPGAFPYALAINDIFDGLFRETEYRERYYRKTWEMLNSTHELGRMLAKIDELYELVKEDVYADSHIHYGSKPDHYMSNAEWEDFTRIMKESFVKRDHYLKWELAQCNLSVSSLYEKNSIPASMKGDYKVLGSLELVSTKRIGPYVDTIKIKFDEHKSLNTKDIVLLDWDSGVPQNLIRPITTLSKSTGSVELSFDIRRAFPVLAKPKPVKIGAGIYIYGMPKTFRTFHFQPVPTTYRLALAIANTSAETEREISSWRVSEVIARNSVTSEPIKVSIGDPNKNIVPVTPEKRDIERIRKIAKEGLPYTLPLTNHPRSPEGGQARIKPDGVGAFTPPEPEIQRTIIWGKGPRRISQDFVVEPDTTLVIEPGAIIKFEKGRSLLVKGLIEAHGNKDEPILFTWAKPEEHWGVVAVASMRPGLNSFRHCIFERSKNAKIGSVQYTGALSLYLAEGSVVDCVFRDNLSDDGINTRYVSPKIVGCRFERNGDAIDIDFGGGLIEGNVFTDNRDDSIDISSSWTKIIGNWIGHSGDKGVSLGEKSRPLVYNNLIFDCDVGVAIKDLSEALVINNTITRNRVGVALYKKKFEFGPGKGRLVNNIIFGNDNEIDTGDGSEFTAEHCLSSLPLSGTNNLQDSPMFNAPEKEDFSLASASPCLGRGSGKQLNEYGFEGENKLTEIGYIGTK